MISDTSIDAFLASVKCSRNDIKLDGTIRELKTPVFNGWYIGNELVGKGATLTAEDWRTKNRISISDGIDKSDPAMREMLAAAREKYQAEKLRLQELKRTHAQNDIKKYNTEASEWRGESAYLQRKQIPRAFGALAIESSIEGTDLIIPMRDEHGAFWNYQTILASGFKSFVPGARVDGLWYELTSENVAPDVIMITEGFATGCSVQQAQPQVKVVCAFTAGNLEDVARAVRLIYPHARIIICADDDWKTEPNTGREAAERAADVACASCAYPVFPKVRGLDWTDFNDLMCGYSIDIVREQLTRAIDTASAPSAAWLEAFSLSVAFATNTATPKKAAKIETIGIKREQSLNAIDPYINGVAPMALRTNKQGMPILPSEFETATELYKYYEGRCIISEESIFIYDQTHWKEVDTCNESKIIVQIQVLYGGAATNSKLKATYEQFVRLIPEAGKNMFIPNPYIINFLNGTLHVEREVSGAVWVIRFDRHKKEDLCTNIIPITYDETRSKRNLEFEAMVDRIFSEAIDKEGKIKALRQMYGACIAPIFPHLFMLHGSGGSGKSSLIIPAQRLVHKDNWAAVEPHEFKGFTMESMVGKLVNIVLDINVQEPIEDSHIKKIEDRVPVRIDRKFKTALNAPLPAVHIFGGNEIPATFEKGSGAHRRRWTFLNVGGFKAVGNYSKNFANEAFDTSPDGVLNWALVGLQEVLDANGHYYVPESSAEKMEEWQIEHDPVAQWVKEIGEGEVENIVLKEGARMKRSESWPLFCEWYNTAYNKKPRISKSRFYNALVKVHEMHLPIELKVFDGVRYFTSLCSTGNVTRGVGQGSAN
jgi:phage/plasmid primase-like uncharacterized protein/phage/plasmid-associated DNA primase